MRILHTSDWHLGMSVGTGTLAGDQRFFLEQLYSIIEEEQADISDFDYITTLNLLENYKIIEWDGEVV